MEINRRSLGKAGLAGLAGMGLTSTLAQSKEATGQARVSQAPA